MSWRRSPPAPCENKPLIIGGRYGLSSKDTTPAQMLAVFANLEGQRTQEPVHGGHRGRRDVPFAARRRGDLAGQARHVRGALLRSGRRRYGGRQQELDQDHRRHDRTNTARPTSPTTRRNRAATRLVAPALRRPADHLALSGHHARLRGLPRAFVCGQVRRAQGPQGRRLVPAQLGARRRYDLRDAARRT